LEPSSEQWQWYSLYKKQEAAEKTCFPRRGEIAKGECQKREEAEEHAMNLEGKASIGKANSQGYYRYVYPFHSLSYNTIPTAYP
jgi:hypothetical protein